MSKCLKMAKVKIVTGKVRLSYCHLFEPRAAAEGYDAKYGVTLLIDKSDKETLEAINNGVAEVIRTEKDSKFGGKEKGLKLPLRDGDEERDEPEFEGCYFINVTAKQRPIILDENGATVLDNREVYSGCYARVSFNLFAFNSNGNKGVACGLNAVKKIADGEPLGGSYTEETAKEDFEDLI